MTNQHPITPTPELVQQWWDAALHNATSACIKTQLCTQAAQWGADMELEACCEWLRTESKTALWQTEALRTVRRPKPPSVKEQALEALDRMDQLPTAEDQHIIRRALEQLDD